MRKYFRAGNQPLKDLLLFGLKKDSTNFELLCDLAFFHEFKNILPELVEHFTNACQQETDLQKFSELAQEFYHTVIGDGYDAMLALENIFDEVSDKSKVIDFLINEFNEQGNSEPVDF